MTIKVLIFGEKDAAAKISNQLVDDEIGVAGVTVDENSVLDDITNLTPDVLIIIDSTAAAMRVCQQVYLLRPRVIPIILSGVSFKDEKYSKIVQTGVHYILPLKIDPVKLIAEIKSIFNNESTRIVAFENSNNVSNKAKVIMIFGAQDGVGKTTFAINLGISLIQNGAKVALLDYDMQFGDVATFLGANPKSNIINLIEEKTNPNADMIRQHMTLHSSGLSFLAAPNSPEEEKVVAINQSERIISALRVYYDYLIVDAGAGFNDVSAMCIDCASNIFVLSNSTVSSVKNTKKVLGIINAIAIENDKTKVVMVASEKQVMSESEVSNAIGAKVYATLAYDKASVESALNLGNPVVIESPRSKYSESVRQFATDMIKENDSAQEG